MSATQQSFDLPIEATHQLYWLTGTDQSWFLAVGMEQQGATLCWFDGSKIRTFEPSEVNVRPDGSFSARKGEKILESTPLTLELYRQHVKRRLYPTTEFVSEQDMRTALFAMKDGVHE
jgi:hypothetical protein